MEITVTQQGKVTVIAMVGAVDTLDVDQIRTALDTQVRDGKTRLVADVGQVEYINSAGLRAMVQTLKDTTRRGGDFRLAKVGPRIQRALDITGLTSLFKVYPDVEAAVASFAA
jgi:anti-anti-sigma factor